MKPKDIDGISSLWGVAGAEPANVDRVDSMDIAWMLGMSPVNWFNSQGTSPAFVGAALNAIAAVKSGMCHTCIAFRVIPQRQSTGDLLAGDGAKVRRVGGDQQFTEPFGSGLPLVPIAGLPAMRHMHKYGTKEEHFGAHVVAQRYHASLNEDAIFRTPLTIDDYLNSRYVSKPMRILDCDYPVDSASAVIFTTEERARDWKKKPVFVESAAYSAVRYNSMDLVDVNHSSPWHCAETLWSRTDLEPKDVDCAQLYDGFTIITFQWLEALGFCGEGESGPFIAAGNTRLGGSLPLNTDGGACNVGRRHGANFCIESVRQLRGESGVRQVRDAKVAVWANAVGFFSGAVLMTAD
jgi:acetyl-CoA acetyltransferase